MIMMKTCPKCQTQVSDDAAFCTGCGVRFETPANSGERNDYTPPQNNTVPAQAQPVYQAYDPYDHTSEFDAKDISENKVFSMLAYLMGVVGVIIALLAGRESPYTTFHVRQAVKFMVVNILLAIAALVFCWTVIVPIACGVLAVILFVIKIICFFQICGGKAKEPCIIRSFGFLK